jgi:hypothetical protein
VIDSLYGVDAHDAVCVLPTVCTRSRIESAWLLLPTLAFFASASCGGPVSHDAGDSLSSSSAAITKGEVDPVDPSVVALVAGRTPYCTGTLVAPRVVLTAAHCLKPTSPDQVAWGEIVGGPKASFVPVVASQVYPSFDPVTLDADVGLLLLGDEPPAPFSLRSSLGVTVGTTVRVVGYGLGGTDLTVGVKRQGFARVAAAAENAMILEAAPSQPCQGDSGGPVFIAEGTGLDGVLAIVSSGDGSCTKGAQATLITRDVQAFIDGFVGRTARASVSAGQRCFYLEQCAMGSCYSPPDAARIMYCAPACVSDRDCPSGMYCAGERDSGRCEYPEPSPGALGAACSVNEDCNDGMCGRTSPNAQPVCSRLCFPEEPNSCGGSAKCLRNTGTPDAFGCFDPSEHAEPPHPVGSCALDGAAHNDGNSGWWAAGLGLIAIARRLCGGQRQNGAPSLVVVSTSLLACLNASAIRLARNSDRLLSSFR